MSNGGVTARPRTSGRRACRTWRSRRSLTEYRISTPVPAPQPKTASPPRLRRINRRRERRRRSQLEDRVVGCLSDERLDWCVDRGGEAVPRPCRDGDVTLQNRPRFDRSRLADAIGVSLSPVAQCDSAGGAGVVDPADGTVGRHEPARARIVDRHDWHRVRSPARAAGGGQQRDRPDADPREGADERVAGTPPRPAEPRRGCVCRG